MPLEGFIHEFSCPVICRIDLQRLVFPIYGVDFKTQWLIQIIFPSCRGNLINLLAIFYAFLILEVPGHAQVVIYLLTVIHPIVSSCS